MNSSRTSASPRSAKLPWLVLTGRRQEGRHGVLINGHEVWLSFALFQALCWLVYYKAKGQGFASQDRVVVYRLRRAIGRCARKTAKTSWIEAGGKGEYHLIISRDQIGYDQTFAELAPAGFIDEEVANVIRRRFRRVVLS